MKHPPVAMRIKAGQGMGVCYTVCKSKEAMKVTSPKTLRLNKLTSCSHCVYKIGQWGVCLW